jgi:hypothetical protein
LLAAKNIRLPASAQLLMITILIPSRRLCGLARNVFKAQPVQLDEIGLCRRIAVSQKTNNVPNESPAMMGITRNKSAGDLPRHSSVTQ